MTSTGDEEKAASSSPVAVFVVPGPVLAMTTPSLPGGARVPVGGVGGRLLVTGAHVGHAAQAVDGLEDGQVVDARDPEHALDAEGPQRPVHRLSSGHRLGGKARRRRPFDLGQSRHGSSSSLASCSYATRQRDRAGAILQARAIQRRDGLPARPGGPTPGPRILGSSLPTGC